MTPFGPRCAAAIDALVSHGFADDAAIARARLGRGFPVTVPAGAPSEVRTLLAQANEEVNARWQAWLDRIHRRLGADEGT